jgi:hypothetical protein
MTYAAKEDSSSSKGELDFSHSPPSLSLSLSLFFLLLPSTSFIHPYVSRSCLITGEIELQPHSSVESNGKKITLQVPGAKRATYHLEADNAQVRRKSKAAGDRLLLYDPLHLAYPFAPPSAGRRGVGGCDPHGCSE